MTNWWIVFVVFISDVGICRFSRSSMLLVYMAPLTLAVITMEGLTFQPCIFIAFIYRLELVICQGIHCG